ncbi:MAG: hypothetical protein HOW73_24010 [Polyangiaceae bacterium]|nr:hypothetical protein [Polyangiaceae bacterium]
MGYGADVAAALKDAPVDIRRLESELEEPAGSHHALSLLDPEGRTLCRVVAATYDVEILDPR